MEPIWKGTSQGSSREFEGGGIYERIHGPLW